MRNNPPHGLFGINQKIKSDAEVNSSSKVTNKDIYMSKKDRKQLTPQGCPFKPSQAPCTVRMKVKRTSTEINDPNLQKSTEVETDKIDLPIKQIELHIQRLRIHGRERKRGMILKYNQPKPYKIIQRKNKTHDHSKIIIEEKGESEISGIEKPQKNESQAEIRLYSINESNNLSKIDNVKRVRTILIQRAKQCQRSI